MNSSSKRLVSALQGKKEQVIPFWFMRQAGRYLPEYRELRSKTNDFLSFCYNPGMAAEATLQPIRRFGMSGAIIFSDILVIPDALGIHVRFEEHKGPILDAVQDDGALDALVEHKEKLLPVYQALEQVKAALPKDTSLIGFVGAPWTLACYMVEGKVSRDFQKVRSTAMSDHRFFTRLVALLTDTVADHAIRQIEAGAEIIQLFDSWAGVLGEQEFMQWVVEPTKVIVAKIKLRYPNVPVIGFPRQAGYNYLVFARETGVDAVNIDASVPLERAAGELQDTCVIQGNLDPLLLAEDKDAAILQARRIISTFNHKSFVFNLGHGILPHTPIENVQALCHLIGTYPP